MAERVTPELVAELRALLAKATHPRWNAVEHEERHVETAAEGGHWVEHDRGHALTWWEIGGFDCMEEHDARLAEALRNHAPAILDALDEARIESSDILEHLGEMAWGIDLPPLVQRFTIEGGAQVHTVPVGHELAKQLVEHLYQKLKKGRGWLKQERDRSFDLERQLLEARAEAQALRAAIEEHKTHARYQREKIVGLQRTLEDLQASERQGIARFGELFAGPMECGHPPGCLPEHTAQEAREHPERIVCGWCADRAALDGVRRKAIEEACTALCADCAVERPVRLVSGRWVHDADSTHASRCYAHDVRALASREGPKGGVGG